MRILHLIDPGSRPCVVRMAAEAVARLDDHEHDALVIGTRRDLDLAGRCGLVARGRLAAPLGRPALARQALRAYLAAWERARGAYDLVHGWTPEAGVLASLACRRRVVAGASWGSDWAPGARWALRILRRRGVPVLDDLPPAVDGASILREERALLRQRYDADATTFVVGLVGEPPSMVDGAIAADIAGRTALAGRDVRLVVHPGAFRQPGLLRWHRRLRIPRLMIADERIAEPWRVAPGLDAVIATARQRPAGRAAPPAVLPVLWMMAAGLVILAEDRGPAAALIEHERTGMLFAPGSFNDAAGLLMRLHDDAALASGLAAAGQADVEERFTPEAFAARLRAAYGLEPLAEQRVRGVVVDACEHVAGE